MNTHGIVQFYFLNNGKDCQLSAHYSFSPLFLYNIIVIWGGEWLNVQPKTEFPNLSYRDWVTL